MSDGVRVKSKILIYFTIYYKNEFTRDGIAADFFMQICTRIMQYKESG